MSFCPKCGAQVPNGTMFCTQCGFSFASKDGASAQQAQNSYTQQQPGGFAQQPQGGFAQQPQGAYYGPDQVLERPILNRGLTAIVGYLGWLGFMIAMIAGDRKEPYARFHLNQSLVMNLAFTAGYILYIIGAAVSAMGTVSYFYGDRGGMIAGLILLIIGVALVIFTFVCWIIGLVRACKGNRRPVVLFGNLRILK